MKVLVFGGAGFLGSYVADELVARGYDVTVFDRRPSKWTPDTATTIIGDILDRDEVVRAAAGFDIVYNFAGFGGSQCLNRSAHRGRYPQRHRQLECPRGMPARRCRAFPVRELGVRVLDQGRILRSQ